MQLNDKKFLKKINLVLDSIPHLENKLINRRSKISPNNPRLFLDRDEEGKIIREVVSMMGSDTKLNEKLYFLLDDNLLGIFSFLSFIYWKQTKRVYQFNNDVLLEVANTNADNIPAQNIFDLPVWSVYISCENLHRDLNIPYPIDGFFFYPLINDNNNVYKFVITDNLKTGKGINGFKEKEVAVFDNIIKIKDSRTGVLESGMWEFKDGEVKETIDMGLKDFRERECNLLNAQISLVLYICSQQNDIKEKKTKGTFNGQKKSNKRNNQSVDKISTWDVGVRMGQALRNYREYERKQNTGATGSSKRPHIRSGHWHTYWTGSKNPDLAHERKPKLTWLSPVPVGMNTEDNMPVTLININKKQ